MAAARKIAVLKPALLARTAVFCLAAAVTSLLFINFCDLIYQCGCRSWWDGAADSCNIHSPAPPHCPWCTHGASAGYASFALILLSQGVIAFWPGEALRLKRRLLAALAAFPIAAALTALWFGWSAGYWAR